MKKLLDREDYLKAKVLDELTEQQKKEVIDALGNYALAYHVSFVKEHKTINFIFRVILRILGIIPFSLIALFTSVAYFLKFIIYYILHGGIAIAYTHLNEYKTVNDVYNQVKYYAKKYERY